MSEITGWRVRSDRPRSPVNSPPRKRKYRVKNGSFRPSRCRSAATISGDALAPTYARAGSPGETACSTKITSDKTSRMSTAAESRRVTKRSINSPPHRHQVADGVATEVGDQAQHQHRDARDAGHPPLTEQLTQ